MNVNAGRIANGSWIDIKAFKMSFMPVKFSMSVKYANEKVGAIAINLVKSTLKTDNLQQFFRFSIFIIITSAISSI